VAATKITVNHNGRFASKAISRSSIRKATLRATGRTTLAFAAAAFRNKPFWRRPPQNLRLRGYSGGPRASSPQTKL